MLKTNTKNVQDIYVYVNGCVRMRILNGRELCQRSVGGGLEVALIPWSRVGVDKLEHMLNNFVWCRDVPTRKRLLAARANSSRVNALVCDSELDGRCRLASFVHQANC